MASKTNEKALEAAIETSLIDAGFHQGSTTSFNAEYALDPHFFWQFLEKTQSKVLTQFQKNNPTDGQSKILCLYAK
jgi:type I restriction enzyme R subunit